MAAFKSVDHIGIVVKDLEVSIPWWNHFLEAEPFWKATWLAADIDDYVGQIVGYENCDMTCAFWSLPGGTVLEMLEYHNPGPGSVDMESYNAGNTHLCLETTDIYRDYERMRGRAEFRSPEPVRCAWGKYKGNLACYLRDPDGISIELVQFVGQPRPFQEQSPFGDPYT